MKITTVIQPGQLPTVSRKFCIRDADHVEAYAIQAFVDTYALLDEETKNYIEHLEGVDDDDIFGKQINAIHSIYANDPVIAKIVDEKKNVNQLLEEERERQLEEIEDYKFEKEFDRLSQLEQQEQLEQFQRQQEELELQALVEEEQRIKRLIQEEKEQQEYMAQQARRAEFLQEFRSQQIGIHNKMVEKTVSDLRDSEYFHTGQTHYLQQQLAELMAKRF